MCDLASLLIARCLSQNARGNVHCLFYRLQDLRTKQTPKRRANTLPLYNVGKLSDTTRMSIFNLFLLIVVLPFVLGFVIKYRHDNKPKKSFEESDVKRRLNKSQADVRFESTWNMVGA